MRGFQLFFYVIHYSLIYSFVDPLSPTAKKYLNVRPKLFSSGSSKDRALQSSTSSSARDNGLVRSNPPSRPGSKNEHRPPSSVGNHLSSGSMQAVPPAVSRQPFIAARVGPVRCPVVAGPSTTGPMRLSKRSDGPVRLLAIEPPATRQPIDGPRRVTIMPMPPPPPPLVVKAQEVKKPVPKSSAPPPARSNKSSAAPDKSGGPLQAAPKSATNDWNTKPAVERQSSKSNVTSTRGTAKPASSSQPPPSKAASTKPAKFAPKAAKKVEPAALPLPPSPKMMPVDATSKEKTDESAVPPLPPSPKIEPKVAPSNTRATSKAVEKPRKPPMGKKAWSTKVAKAEQKGAGAASIKEKTVGPAEINEVFPKLLEVAASIPLPQSPAIEPVALPLPTETAEPQIEFMLDSPMVSL